MGHPARISSIQLVWFLVGTLTFGAQLTALLGREEPFSWRGPDGVTLPFSSPEEVEDFLQTARVVEVEGIEKGITNPRRLLLERDGVRMHAIFRGVDIFKSVWRTPDGIKLDYHDSCRYEYAAYKLSRLLEIGRVPPVVERKFEREDFQDDRDYDKLRDARKGTVQAWVEDAMTEMERRKAGQLPPNMRQWVAEWQRMYLFDGLTFNDDRNLGNILIGPDWKIWLIDSTRSFRPFRELREPRKIKLCDARVWKRLLEIEPETLRSELEGTLEPKVLDCLVARYVALVEHIQQLLHDKGERLVLVKSLP